MIEPLPRGGLLQVRRAPDGAAAGVARRARAAGRRGGRPADLTAGGDRRRRLPLRCRPCPTDLSPSWPCTPIPTTRRSARAASWPATPTRACAPCWSRAPTASSATRRAALKPGDPGHDEACRRAAAPAGARGELRGPRRLAPRAPGLPRLGDGGLAPERRARLLLAHPGGGAGGTGWPS